MTSLRKRLSVGLGGLMILLLAGQWLFVTLTVDGVIENELDEQLQHETEQLLSAISWDANNQILIKEHHLNAFYQTVFSGHYYLILDESGEEIQRSRSLWDYKLKAKTLGTGESYFKLTDGPADQQLQLRAAGYTKQDHQLSLILARDVQSLREQRQKFHYQYLLLSLLGLVVVLFVQQDLIRRMTKPLKRTRRQMAKLEKGTIEQLDANHLPDEIRPVILELNRLLKGFKDKTRRSREAQGNLAHALKTRIAVLNQIIDAAEMPDALKPQLNEISQAIQASVQRELKRARVMGGSIAGSRLDIVELVNQLANTLIKIHHKPGLDIKIAMAHELYFRADREDVIELLGNIMDNACHWCNHQVKVSSAENDQGLYLNIEDDGPGCDAETLIKLARRGFRADESRPGSGLGLAISNDIVQGYNGELNFARSSELGGLKVTVFLPGQD